MTAIDLSKQHTLDADSKAIQQINFTGTLARDSNENTTIFLMIEETKKKQKKLFWIFHKEL